MGCNVLFASKTASTTQCVYCVHTYTLYAVYCLLVESCKLVTICFSPSVLDQFGINSKLVEERRMLINLALSYLSDTKSLKLSSSFTLVRDQTHIGDLVQVQKHALENRNVREEDFSEEVDELEKTFGTMPPGCKDSLLHQLSNLTVTNIGEGEQTPGDGEGIKLLDATQPPNRQLIKELSSEQPKIQTPQHKVLLTDERLTVKVDLPGVTNVQDCMLDIAEVGLHRI